MFKKLIVFITSLVAFLPISFGKKFHIGSSELELDNSFLESLDKDQAEYLFQQLEKQKVYIVDEETGVEYLDVELSQLELLSRVANDPTTGTQPPD